LIQLHHHIQVMRNGNFLLDEGQNHSYVSGNKIRKFKGILRSQTSVKGLITLGSVYSSHCLTTAFFGAYLKKPVVLIIIADEKIDSTKFPHLKASLDFGAQILFVSSQEATEFIDFQQERYNDYLWIPGGGHTKDASEEYCSFFIELFKNNLQLSTLKQVVLPYGTGTTAFGICKAIAALQLSMRVIGVSVARNKERCIKSALDFAETKEEVSPLIIVEDYAGLYEKRTERTESARRRFFQETSVLPDPIYNAKSIEYFYRNNMRDTLLVNTGGTLNNLL